MACPFSVLRYTVCEVKVCVAKGSAIKCPLPVVRYRVIRAKVCVALRNVQFPCLSSLRHMELSRKVCVAEVWSVACSLSVLRYTVCEVKVCVAEGEDMPGIVGLRSRRDKQLHLCGSISIQCEASRNSFFGQRVFDIQHLGYEKKLFM